MTYKIEARDVKPGMEIEWTDNGWTYSGTISEAQRSGCSRPSMSFQNTDQVWQHVAADQEVTVLSDPQPEEPTAFGAAVEVAGVKYVRIDHREYSSLDYQPWMDSFEGSYSHWNQLTSLGPVTVVIRDPFATPEMHDATEFRKWDRWGDVPDMTAVRARNIKGLFRRNGDRVERLLGKDCWRTSPLTPITLNSVIPFTEVRDA